MSPLGVAILVFFLAAVVAILLYGIFHNRTTWFTVESQLAAKRVLGFRGDEGDVRILLTIERNVQTGEEYAWVTEESGDRDRLQLDKAKEIIASCKQSYRE